MRLFILVFSFCIVTQVNAAQAVSECQSFIANDNDLENYPILKPDCTIVLFFLERDFFHRFIVMG